MQPILDGPRVKLSEAKVKALLQSHSALTISYGATALDSTFAEVGDISAYMSSGSSISSDVTQSIHRTCSLNIDADATDGGWSYLSGFVRPEMTFTDTATGYSATFNLGVYTLTTPTLSLDNQPPTLAFSGYDLLYLLQQDVGDSYEVAAGEDPAQAAADAISLAVPNAAVNVIPSGSTLTGQLTWPFDADQPVTYMQIVQTLLSAIGYRAVWVDWDGQFRIEPFIDLQSEPSEWTFDTEADDNIVADDITQDVDIFDVPNWWRFVISNLTDLPVEGVTQFTWTDSSSGNPGSTQNRGRIVRHIESVPATSYADLVQYAQSTIAATLAPGETFTVNTQPFPLAWHLDVFTYLDSALSASLPATPGGVRRVVSTTWSLPLDGQTDMSWTWQTITDQSAALGLTTTEED